ncbi:MAG: BrnA antitoxin family protein [Hydrogenovibrio sp.]
MANKTVVMPTDKEDKQATQHGLEDGTLMDDLNLQAMQNLSNVLPDLVKAQQQGELKARPVGRPKTLNPKQAVTVRYDAEIIEYFKSTGKGWQTRMNDALNEWMKEHATH